MQSLQYRRQNNLQRQEFQKKRASLHFRKCLKERNSISKIGYFLNIGARDGHERPDKLHEGSIARCAHDKNKSRC